MTTALGGHDIVDLAKRLRQLDEERSEVAGLMGMILNTPSVRQPTNGKSNGHAVHTHATAPAPAESADMETLDVKRKKKEFVKICLRNNPGTNPKDINFLWKKKGGKDTISTSTFYSTKKAIVKEMVADARAAKKVAAAPRKVATAVAEPDLRKAVWALLSKQPMTLPEIQAAIQERKLVSPLPRKLPDLVKTVLDEFRDTEKVLRGDNRRYGIAHGASLN